MCSVRDKQANAVKGRGEMENVHMDIFSNEGKNIL
jgi:hypothetical protein